MKYKVFYFVWEKKQYNPNNASSGELTKDFDSLHHLGAWVKNIVRKNNILIFRITPILKSQE